MIDPVPSESIPGAGAPGLNDPKIQDEDSTYILLV